jgi:hypothetical protein
MNLPEFPYTGNTEDEVINKQYHTNTASKIQPAEN